MSWGHHHSIGVGVLAGLSLASHALVIAFACLAAGILLGLYGSRLYKGVTSMGALLARRLS